LWIVTPGESMIMGSELLSSSRMLEFIQETRKYFDVIIYDTAPITLISDASVLLSHLHGAILVTRTGVTQGRIIPKAIRMIRNANTKLIGVVLNSNATEVNNKYYHRYYRD
jgi:protein-tyrosine kinase